MIVQQNRRNSNNKCRTDLSADSFIGSDFGGSIDHPLGIAESDPN
jgi:hypothetical protein